MSLHRHVTFNRKVYKGYDNISKTHTYETIKITGLFHGWGLEVDEDSKASFTIAIVEKPDGTIEYVHAEGCGLQFVENLSHLMDLKTL